MISVDSDPADAGRHSFRKTVLVFPCGSEIGLEIHRALRFSRHFELIGASSTHSNHGRYVFDRYIDGLPFVSSPGFVDALNCVIDEQAVDFVFPAHDQVVLALAEQACRLRAQYVGSPVVTCRICRSKRATYEYFSGRIRVPRLFGPDIPAAIYPVFLKPDVGQGSKGVHTAYTQEEVSFYTDRDRALLVLEHIPGQEYTVDCLTDRFRRLVFVGARERIRVSNGISVDTAPVVGEEYRTMAKAINSTLHLRGAWFFQAKRATGGELTLLEIGPRVSGSMALYRNLGINYEALTLFDLMNKEIEILQNRYSIRMDRALTNRFCLELQYENVYIDLDDSIIDNGRVNPLVVAFLYQCRNRGIRLHLVSRHLGELRATLRCFALEQLFDTVAQVPPESCKSEYISEPGAIFVDDSFAERKAVHARLGIPTFAIDAVESLIHV